MARLKKIFMAEFGVDRPLHHGH